MTKAESKEEYRILNMEKEDLNLVFKYWEEEEGCHNSQNAIEPIFNIDPNGFFKGVIGNELVSTIFSLRYSDDFAFIGYFLVRKKYRKNDYGKKIFNKALEYCGERIIELISVPEQEDDNFNYKKRGFTTSGYIIYHIGNSSHTDVKLNVLKYDEENHLDDIAKYDQECFPANRKEFLKAWLKKRTTQTFVYYDDDNKFKGYGSIYYNGSEYDISPCYCDTKEIATAIIGALANSIEEGSIFTIFAPKLNQSSADFFTETNDIYQWEEDDELPIMYKNGFPKNINLQKCYAIVSDGIG